MLAAQTQAAKDVAYLTTTVTEIRNETQKLETKINSVIVSYRHCERRQLSLYPHLCT